MHGIDEAQGGVARLNSSDTGSPEQEKRDRQRANLSDAIRLGPPGLLLLVMAAILWTFARATVRDVEIPLAVYAQTQATTLAMFIAYIMV